jgi:hypothetical protein
MTFDLNAFVHDLIADPAEVEHECGSDLMPWN